MQNYTYKLDTENLFRNSLYIKRTPKNAAISIFRRLLHKSEKDVHKAIIIVKNLDNNKLFYYECIAVYNPTQKMISKHKFITIYYEINILKLNKKCFD